MYMRPIPTTEIGFDIDGVVADTTEAFLRLARDQFMIPDLKESEITEFDVAKCLPIAPKIVEEIFDILLEDPIGAGMQVMPGAIRVLEQMSHTSHLTFITARPLANPINDWLEYNLPASIFQQIRLSATGEHDGKLPYIKERKLRFFVDDRTETCLNLQKEGITPLVFNQPWNQGRHNLDTVADWPAIAAKLDLNQKSL